MKSKKFVVILIMLIFILNISKSYAVSEAPEISSESAVLIESSSEKILYSKKGNRNTENAILL